MHFAFRVIGDALYMIAMCVFAILFARIRLFFFLQKIIGIQTVHTMANNGLMTVLS